MKVRIIQTDNRPLIYYLSLTKKVNEQACENLSYNYTFIPIPEKYTSRMHPAAAKILVVNEYIQTTTDDVVVFLDTDAWVHNAKHLDKIIKQLVRDPTKHGCFSRDTEMRRNTYINSGAFVLKVNDYTRNMYNHLTRELSRDATHHYKWPYDQFYISKFVYENRGDFIVYKPEVFNTPAGLVLRHNWNKDPKMYFDLYDALNNQQFVEDPSRFIDDAVYPNPKDGVDYVYQFPPMETHFEMNRPHPQS